MLSIPWLLGLSLLLGGAWIGYLLGGRRSCRYLAEAERARDAAEHANRELLNVVESLERVAGTDRLTGLWNRRRLEEAGTTLIALAGRRGDPLSLLFFDLDYFKRVNDTYGHAVGDAVLATVAEVVREQLRASDFLARWGGEEFLILAAGTRLEGAMALGEKIRLAVASTVFPGCGSLTLSLGVAEYGLGEEFEHWIARGDQALYRAKEGGRNRLECASRVVGLLEGVHAIPFRLNWDDAYASGQPQIDAQHQELFELTNSLFASMDGGQPSADLGLHLRRLIAHVAQHFHDEEARLLEVGYPALPAHAAEHQRLLSSIQDLEQDLDAGRLDLGRLVTFLAVEVVRDHLLQGDRDYFGCFKTPPASSVCVIRRNDSHDDRFGHMA